MPTQLNTPPAEFDFLEEAERQHTIAGYDFARVFDYYFTTGWMNKGPGHFLMGGHDPEREDAWLVWWAQMNPPREPRMMLRTMLRCVPYHKPWICWSRPLKGRVDKKYYSTDRLLSFTQTTKPHATIQ